MENVHTYPKFTPEMKATHKILIPNMAPIHFEMMRAAMEDEGYHVEVLGSGGHAVAQEGLKYVHNDTCYPALLVIGQFINALKSGDIGFVHSWDINTSVDGPGTRMTVFMSGCPLRCQYCQNPDTWKMRDGKPVYYEAMVKKIERYVDLFKATHGGITFSGGESMMQPAFVSRVFRAAKEMGVHTCLDTSGFLGASYTDDMLNDIDLCLLDVKSGDEETYKKVTGGILQPTIDFGQRLAKAGKKIWVRFVLVPGLTSSEENVENVAKICESFGDAVEHIDVLGFHQLGRPKWHMLNIPYPLEDQKGPSEAMKQRVVEQFQSHGFTVY